MDWRFLPITVKTQVCCTRPQHRLRCPASLPVCLGRAMSTHPPSSAAPYCAPPPPNLADWASPTQDDLTAIRKLYVGKIAYVEADLTAYALPAAPRARRAVPFRVAARSLRGFDDTEQEEPAYNYLPVEEGTDTTNDQVGRAGAGMRRQMRLHTRVPDTALCGAGCTCGHCLGVQAKDSCAMFASPARQLHPPSTHGFAGRLPVCLQRHWRR